MGALRARLEKRAASVVVLGHCQFFLLRLGAAVSYAGGRMAEMERTKDLTCRLLAVPKKSLDKPLAKARTSKKRRDK